jgi:CheY-like chemotaxis protein/anti-sigma regulatory factor (Ser/Thr protein kinase)
MELVFVTRASAKGLQFAIEQVGLPQCRILGDLNRIGQILINLLGNALKFTEQGRVTLRISTAQREGREWLHLDVEDQGIGIAPEVQQRLFQPFEQADNSISRRFGGTGLGLHISRSLAELMGGRIEVESREGEGACFTLILPLKREPRSAQQPQDAAVATESLPLHFEGKVLMAEDTVELQVLIKRIVAGYGPEVTVASNGREAVELWQQGAFDLVLMDMQMPEVDGVEATRQLRALGCKTPIIALTANVMQKHRELFTAAGGDGFLPKPLEREKLQRVLNRYLQPQR